MTTIQSYTKAAIDAWAATLATSSALASGLASKADVTTVTSLSTNVGNMGYVKDGQLTANGTAVGGTETDSGLTTGSFNVIYNRKYRIDVFAMILGSTAGNIASCQLANASNTVLAQNNVLCHSNIWANACNMTYVFTASSSTSTTFKLRLALVVGSGTVQINAGATFPALILVTDIT